MGGSRFIRKKRSGQMIFEFIVASILFFTIIFYVIGFVSGSVTVASTDLQSNIIESKAVQISEIIVRTPGKWEVGIPISAGLVSDSRGWPFLSSQKIQNLGSYCGPGHDALRSSFGLMDVGGYGRSYELSIRITRGNTTILDCGAVREGEMEAAVRRFGVAENGDLLAVDVVVSS